MDNLIALYINKITLNNINDFAQKNNILLNKKELNILFEIIKTRYNEILNNDATLKKYLKDNLTDVNYNKIIKLYEEYRTKYGNYLL